MAIISAYPGFSYSQGALDREGEIGTTENENLEGLGVNTTPLLSSRQGYALCIEVIFRLTLLFRLEGRLDMFNPIDLSPISYLDSIMNGKFNYPI